MSGFKMDDYVDVAARIEEFYERYPEGSLRSGERPYVLDLGGKTFVVYHAQAFRSPDDRCPADGWAWEPVPGPTQFTKDSELMNAETAAWGRAIVAAGFKTKKIASANEVRARKGSAGSPTADSDEARPATPPRGGRSSVRQAADSEPALPAEASSSTSPFAAPPMTDKVKEEIRTLIDECAALRGVSAEKVSAAVNYSDTLTLPQAGELVQKLRRHKENLTKDAA